MCGIVAYVGTKEAYPIIIKGLKRLEYRGYDSAGIALVRDNELLYQIGFCRMKFDRPTCALRFFQWVATFDTRFTSFGDQGIVIELEHLHSLGGIPMIELCEDIELYHRARQVGFVRCCPIDIEVSARKFVERGTGVYMLQCIVVCSCYFLGVPPRILRSWYVH